MNEDDIEKYELFLKKKDNIKYNITDEELRKISQNNNYIIYLGNDEMLIKILGCGGIIISPKYIKYDEINNKKNIILFENIEKYMNINMDKIYNKKILRNISVKKYSNNWWTRNLHILICKYLFDKEVYKNIYNIDNNINDLWNYWIKIGINKKEVCYKFNIPENFDYVTYAKMNKIKNENKYYVSLKYMKDKENDWNNKNILLSNNNKINNKIYNNLYINYFDKYKLFNIFHNIEYFNNNNEKYWDELIKFLKLNPIIKINDLLNIYINENNLI
jgi:hypothetical protein